jgi:lysophospholipase L1-like esterase
MVWKGRIGDTVVIESNVETTACGPTLIVGQSYLIDADRKSDSALSISKCGWSRSRDTARRLEMLLRASAPATIGSSASALSVPPADDPTRFEPEIRAFEAQDRASPPRSGSIVFVGSSSIKNWTDVASDFPALPVLNRGFGGSTLADVLYYADRVVFHYHPRLVVLYAGDNDLEMGRTPDRVVSDYRLFIKEVRSRLPETRVVYVSIKPSPARRAYLEAARETNKRIETEISHDSLASYIDVFTPMLDSIGQPRSELFGSDSLHMTSAGYQLWRTLLQPVVR